MVDVLPTCLTSHAVSTEHTTDTMALTVNRPTALTAIRTTALTLTLTQTHLTKAHLTMVTVLDSVVSLTPPRGTSGYTAHNESIQQGF